MILSTDVYFGPSLSSTDKIPWAIKREDVYGFKVTNTLLSSWINQTKSEVWILVECCFSPGYEYIGEVLIFP